jgi:methionine-rich copper-binding protein CopC
MKTCSEKILIKLVFSFIFILCSSSVYSGVTFVDSFSVSSQETQPTGLAFNSNGTKMFVIGWAGDDVNEYTLSTGFDVSTASYDSNFSVRDQETQPAGLAFNSDGTKMFVIGSSGDDVNEYTLSTGFDVSTASYDSNFSVSSQENAPTGLAFNSNGTKMFVIGWAGDDVNEYTLSTGFDVSTASYDSNFSVSSQESTPQGLAFNSNGTKMFVIGSSDDVNKYTLSTGFDVSTASYDSDFKVESQESAPKGLAFNSDGTKMFVTGYHGDDVNEYTLSTGFNLVDDSTAPTTTFSPANSATAVAVASDITLTFNEAVRLINNSALDDSNVDALITLKENNSSGADIAFNATINGGKTVITINPDSNLSSTQVVYVAIGATVEDAANNAINAANVSFTTADVSAPTMTITSAEVSDGASSNDSTLAMTFTSSEATSNFVVGDISVSGGALSSFNATSTTVYTATFTPSGDGAKTIDVAGGAFTDSSSNNNSAATQFNWTYDATSPTLSSSTPADDAPGVAVDANIVLTFSKAVDVQSGNIVIKKSSDDSTVETIAVTGSKVTGTGTTSITINPATTLTLGWGYYLNIAATAFDDTSGNSYVGISDKTTLNFFTAVKSNPTLKKDVIGLIGAWSDISSSWVNSNIKSVQGRIDWLNRHKGSNKTSYQGIQINFADTLINKIMNNTPGAALSDIDAVDTAASLIGSSNATLDEVGDNAEVKATDIAINEAARLREGLIGSLNPSFGPVTGNWSVWTEGEVTIGKTDASTAASKKKSSAQAITLGFDRPIRSGNELMGFVFSAGQSDTDIGTASTSVKSNNYSLLNYSVFNTKGAQLESVFGIGQLDFDTTRTDGSDALTGTRKANQLLFSSTIRPQRTINLGSWQLSPYTKVSLANTRLNSFSESGGATALTFNKQEIKDGALGVGFDISTLIKDRGNTIQPFAKIEYARSSSKTSASMHYNDEDASLYTYTTSLNKNDKNWKMKLGFDLNTKSNWDMSLIYIREQSKGSSDGSKSSSNGLSFNAGIKF